MNSRIAEKVKETMNNLKLVGQEHILRFWDELSETQKEEFLKEIDTLELDLIKKFKGLIGEKDKIAGYIPGTLEPYEVIRIPKTPKEKALYAEAVKKGEDALRAGKVGAILVAGGQGSRLGFNGPKGVFQVGPITDRTLFQYHTEKIMALEKRFNTVIPFYIMTSKMNHQDTMSFFENHNYFNRPKESFIFFSQGMLPTLDEDGCLILENKAHLSLAPDGHGGLIKALDVNGLVKDMADKGIDWLYYFQVDNVLVNICDPAFIGYHIGYESEMSAKTVYKLYPEEKLGNIGLIDGKVATIEYTELSEEEKNARTSDSLLKFGQGSIAIHVFSRSFFERLLLDKKELPYHIAHKKITKIDQNGHKIVPDEPNGYKFEQFIFDIFPYAKKVAVMETDRSEDFSPIKNAEGVDSPETARADLMEQFARWLEGAGISIERDVTGNVKNRIEISPLYANDEQSLKSRIRENFSSKEDLLLE